MPRAATVTTKQILQLIEKQNYKCAISGRQLTPETASIDHIVPLARGGTHTIENLWIVDIHVNTAKGTLTMEEFLAMCLDVASMQTVSA